MNTLICFWNSRYVC